MSKKNKLSTRRAAHAFDLERERVEREQKLKKQAKKQEKVLKGVVKPKQKGIRIRKGVRVRGIIVKDSDSKKKALKILRKEKAMRSMEVDAAPKAKHTKRAAKPVASAASKAAAAVPMEM